MTIEDDRNRDREHEAAGARDVDVEALDEAIEAGPITDVEVLLQKVSDHIATARAMPMSASVMINREETLDLVEDARLRLPEELRAARWLLKEREDFLARTSREGDDILESARARSELMVQRTEIVKAAEYRARKIVETAEDEARRIRLECEDFCDQRLAQFEIVLERTMKMVVAGREKLAAPVLHTGTQAAVVPEDDSDSAFFDQDQS